jgi:hypothetical protein
LDHRQLFHKQEISRVGPPGQILSLKYFTDLIQKSAAGQRPDEQKLHRINIKACAPPIPGIVVYDVDHMDQWVPKSRRDGWLVGLIITL